MMPDASTPAEASEVMRLLRQIAGDVRMLRRARNTGGALSAADRAALVILLPAVADAVGNLYFTSRELIAHGQADSILLSALVRVYGSITTGTARRIGKLLTRADGFALDDLRVVRVGDARDGVLWSVVRV